MPLETIQCREQLKLKKRARYDNYVSKVLE